MPNYQLGGVTPQIHPEAFVHPDAVIIGDVTVGAHASVWPGAVLRGDYGRIDNGKRTSIQDGTVIHASADAPTLISADCVVGHNCHLEGVLVGRWCVIGSMSTCLPGSEVGEGSVIAAHASVPPGMRVPPTSQVMGVPGRVRPDPVRTRPAMRDGVGTYLDNAVRYRNGLHRIG